MRNLVSRASHCISIHSDPSVFAVDELGIPTVIVIFSNCGCEMDKHPNWYPLTRSVTHAFGERVRNQSPLHHQYRKYTNNSKSWCIFLPEFPLGTINWYSYGIWQPSNSQTLRDILLSIHSQRGKRNPGIITDK